MTFEGFMLELGKEFPIQLIMLSIIFWLMIFISRMKTKMYTFDDKVGKKIQDQLKELLLKYGSNDFICFSGFVPWVTIGQQFLVRIEPQGYTFLTEYLFRPRYKFVLMYHYKNRGKSQKLGVYTDLEKLVHDYIKFKKEAQQQEKLQKLNEDF